MEITKKYLEQILDEKLGKQTSLFDSKLDKQTKVLSEQMEQLARMTKNGFDDVIERLDVRQRVDKLEKEFRAMKTALHLS